MSSTFLTADPAPAPAQDVAVVNIADKFIDNKDLTATTEKFDYFVTYSTQTTVGQTTSDVNAARFVFDSNITDPTKSNIKSIQAFVYFGSAVNVVLKTKAAIQAQIVEYPYLLTKINEREFLFDNQEIAYTTTRRVYNIVFLVTKKDVAVAIGNVSVKDVLLSKDQIAKDAVAADIKILKGETIFYRLDSLNVNVNSFLGAAAYKLNAYFTYVLPYTKKPASTQAFNTIVGGTPISLQADENQFQLYRKVYLSITNNADADLTFKMQIAYLDGLIVNRSLNGFAYTANYEINTFRVGGISNYSIFSDNAFFQQDYAVAATINNNLDSFFNTVKITTKVSQLQFTKDTTNNRLLHFQPTSGVFAISKDIVPSADQIANGITYDLASPTPMSFAVAANTQAGDADKVNISFNVKQSRKINLRLGNNSSAVASTITYSTNILATPSTPIDIATGINTPLDFAVGKEVTKITITGLAKQGFTFIILADQEIDSKSTLSDDAGKINLAKSDSPKIIFVNINLNSDAAKNIVQRGYKITGTFTQLSIIKLQALNGQETFREVLSAQSSSASLAATLAGTYRVDAQTTDKAFAVIYSGEGDITFTQYAPVAIATAALDFTKSIIYYFDNTKPAASSSFNNFSNNVCTFSNTNGGNLFPGTPSQALTINDTPTSVSCPINTLNVAYSATAYTTNSAKFQFDAILPGKTNEVVLRINSASLYSGVDAKTNKPTANFYVAKAEGTNTNTLGSFVTQASAASNGVTLSSPSIIFTKDAAGKDTTTIDYVTLTATGVDSKNTYVNVYACVPDTKGACTTANRYETIVFYNNKSADGGDSTSSGLSTVVIILIVIFALLAAVGLFFLIRFIMNRNKDNDNRTELLN